MFQLGKSERTFLVQIYIGYYFVRTSSLMRENIMPVCSILGEVCPGQFQL